jgi:hypothetical protein
MVISQDIQQKLEKHREEKAEATTTAKTSSDKKFNDEELNKINEIKSNYDSITLRMGQLHFELNSLTTEKSDLEFAFKKNREEEIDFAKHLTEKYGKGSLDISTGIFTPTE